MTRIAGYLDVVTDSFLIGWIADKDHPETLATLVCRGANGARLEFKPFIPRQDVCNALGITGRFGFAIPVAAVRELGAVVSVTDENGGFLSGGEKVALSPAPDFPEIAHTICVVLHIPKTAGTSLRVALSQSLGQGEFLFLYGDGFNGVSTYELTQLPLAQRSALRLVMGHTYFGVGDCLPGKAEYVTFLRDPELRLRSNYYHAVSASAEYPIEGIPTETHVFVQNGLTGDFDNVMTRMLIGKGINTLGTGCVSEEHVDQALHNIRTQFRFVGLTEHMNEHYPVLCQALGLPAGKVTFENSRQVEDTGKWDMKIDWPEVFHRNRFDAMLYERVQNERLCGRDLHYHP